MKAFIFYVLLLISFNTYSQVASKGIDGSPNIAGTINAYTYLTQDAIPCNETLHLANTSEFKANDLVLIIQMQGANIDDSNTPTYGSITNYKNAGNFEFAEIRAVQSNSILLKYSLLNTYNTSGSVQIVRVPQYQSPKVTGTLNCPNWNGKTGGVLVLTAKDTIYMTKDINVMGKGFRGAQHYTAPCIFDVRYEYYAESPNPRYYALKGEGIAFYGIADFTSGRGAPANAGGGGNIHTTGGGGGANYGCGGDGGWGYPVDLSGGDTIVYGLGGHALSYSNSERKVFMGGGGGAGHEHYGNGTSGANGGGIVIIVAKTIVTNGHSIYALGNNSTNGGAYGDGVGGAGAGGSVLLDIENIKGKLTIDVKGGSGGSSINKGFGPGGGGGGGLCWVNSPTLLDSIIIKNSGGIKGLAGGIEYGGSNGCDGGYLTDLSILYNTTYPPVHADFALSPEYFAFNNVSYTDNTTITFTNTSSGGTSSAWDFGDNAFDNTSNPIHTYTTKGTYTIQLKESNAMCSDSAQKTITTELEMADVFTPNGDGINDFFPQLISENIHAISIFNRWGEEVFSGDTFNYKWDGTYQNIPIAHGTYFYVIEFINSDTLEKTSSTGTITLLR